MGVQTPAAGKYVLYTTSSGVFWLPTFNCLTVSISISDNLSLTSRSEISHWAKICVLAAVFYNSWGPEHHDHNRLSPVSIIWGWASSPGAFCMAQHSTRFSIKVDVKSDCHFLALRRRVEGETAGSSKWQPTTNR